MTLTQRISIGITVINLFHVIAMLTDKPYNFSWTVAFICLGLSVFFTLPRED